MRLMHTHTHTHTLDVDWMYNADIDYKREENRDIFDGNLSRLQNEGNQIKVLHFPLKNGKLCPGRDLYCPGKADE